MTGYRCLSCHAIADERDGCPSCGSPPDPLGAEISRLGDHLAVLDQRDLALRHEFAAITAQRHDLRQRLAARWAEATRRGASPPAHHTPPTHHPAPAHHPVAAERPTAPGAGAQPAPVMRPPGQAAGEPAPPVPTTASWSPTRPGAPRPETSTRSVQNILLVLGGLLLGVAAIVFTAVAWATFGLAGRASILVAITGIGLAVPVVLRRRGLSATAETIAAVGLLLVLLDGYAVWSVNLLGVQQVPATGYAAAVFATTSLVALAYQRVSRLSGPWYTALLAVQPVLPLLAAAAGGRLVGYAAGFAGTAAINLAAVGSVHRVTPDRRGLRLVGLILFLTAGGVAALTALVELITTGSAGAAALAGAILVAVAGLAVAGASHSTAPTVRTVAGGVAAVAVVLAVARPVALLLPGYGLLTAAVTTVLVWATVRAMAAAWPGDPAHPMRSWYAGPLVACWATAALIALPAAVWALIGATAVLAAVGPVWHTDLAAW
ncbi:MAG: hypothetical protein ACRDTU_18385, partial [Micromonosporaceae bacterium]